MEKSAAKGAPPLDNTYRTAGGGRAWEQPTVAGLAVDRTRCIGEHAPPELVNGRRCSDWVRSGPPQCSFFFSCLSVLVSSKSACDLHVLMVNPPAGEHEEPLSSIASEDSGVQTEEKQNPPASSKPANSQTVSDCSSSSRRHQACCCCFFSYVKLGRIALICLRLCDARSSAETLTKRNDDNIASPLAKNPERPKKSRYYRHWSSMYLRVHLQFVGPSVSPVRPSKSKLQDLIRIRSGEMKLTFW